MDVHKNTTHVIANKNRRTAKVRVAARNPKIKIVTTAWLFDCVSRWRRLDEAPYLIEVEPEQKVARAISPILEEGRNGELSSSEDETAPVDKESNGQSPLHLDTAAATATEDGEEDEQDGSLSPGDQVTDDQWKAMMAEIDEASDTEDGTDGDESDASQVSEKSITMKRKRAESRPASQNSTDGEDEGSKLQRRKRRALERTSSLTNVAHATNGNGVSAAQPSPTKMKDVTGREEVVSSQPPSEAGTEESDDGLNAAMEAELAAQLDAAETDPE